MQSNGCVSYEYSPAGETDFMINHSPLACSLLITWVSLIIILWKVLSLKISTSFTAGWTVWDYWQIAQRALLPATDFTHKIAWQNHQADYLLLSWPVFITLSNGVNIECILKSNLQTSWTIIRHNSVPCVQELWCLQREQRLGFGLWP